MRQSKKNILIEAGLQMFYRYGYHGCSVDDITRSIKMPKGSFYNYYKSKEELAIQAIKEYTQKTITMHQQIWHSEKGTAKEKFIKIFESMVGYLEQVNNFQHGCLIGNMGLELSDNSETVRSELKKSISEIKAGFVAMLNQADIPKVAGMNNKELADYLFDSWEGVILRMKIEKSRAPLNRYMTMLFFLLDHKKKR